MKILAVAAVVTRAPMVPTEMVPTEWLARTGATQPEDACTDGADGNACENGGNPTGKYSVNDWAAIVAIVSVVGLSPIVKQVWLIVVYFVVFFCVIAATKFDRW